MTRYIPTIGVEVHVELATRTKMFCSCPHPSHVTRPNEAVCPVCLGLPGTLPVVNERAARLGLRAACALHCRINPELRFERKNYQYPDLVKGYQISQYVSAIGVQGYLDLDPEEIDDVLDAHDAPGGGLRVHIRQAHLEEDTARLVHSGGASLVDANRSSAPLLEIVTQASFHSAKAAESYVRRLRTLLVFHGVSRCRPEAGEMRVEANVSVAPEGAKEYGVRVEIKNQAGFQYMRDAINYEIRRHTSALERGDALHQETRGWDSAKGETFFQRSKENAHDYRYFPDPDIPAPVVPDAWIAEEKAHTAEAPDDYIARLRAAGLTDKTVAAVISQDALGFLRSAEAAAAAAGHAEVTPERLARRLVNDVFAMANKAGTAMADCALTPEALAGTVALEAAGTVDAEGARRALSALFADGGDAAETVRRLGLAADAHDHDAGAEAVAAVLAEHPEWVAEFKAGKTSVKNALFGAVMKKLARKGNAKAIGALLDEKLAGP